MNWSGKIFGALIGLILGGPLGLFIGLLIGHLYDQGIFDSLLQSLGFQGARATSSNKIQEVFFNTTFQIMGYIAKSDGRVSEREIAAAQHVMAQMGLNENMRRAAIELFNQGKQPHFDPNAAITALKQSCWRHPSLLRTFLEIQIQMAYAEGNVLSVAKRAALQNICTHLGIPRYSYTQFEEQFRARQNYYRHSQQQKQSPQQHLEEAYSVLGISTTAEDADIKKAYRRLMSKNHPDKLIAKGVPQEMIKLATQKTQQIKSAYETIRKARGF